jgi:MraZ protein
VIPYIGEYRYSVDPTGRVNVPARFREVLTQESSPDLVMLKGLDGCVVLLPLSTWARFRAPLDDDRLITDRLARWFSRDLLRDGAVVQPDSQGRVQLTPGLREYAGITDACVIYGNDNKIEIWAPEVFDRYTAAGKTIGPSLEEGAAAYMRRSADARASSNDEPAK